MLGNYAITFKKHEMKKSFLLYIDLLEVIDELTDEQAGKLFKAIKDFMLGKELDLDPIIKVAFHPIKTHLLRDSGKYDEVVQKRKEAGVKGARQKLANAEIQKQMLANAKTNKQSLANLADNVNDNVNGNDNVNDNVNDIYEIPLAKCVEIALRDEKYARLNKLVGPADFEPFIEKLETEGCYLKTPIDFKAHFARWKKKQPIAPKEIPIRPIREQDKWF